MKKILMFSLLLIIFSSCIALAQIDQTVEISSSPNPVGSGARALGMGGAFIGVADDATAASWNPAGLIQLETPEVSIVGSFNRRTEDSTYIAFPEASGQQDITTNEVNYFSFAYPFTIRGTNMIVSLNYQHLYDFNKKVSFGYHYSDLVAPAIIMQNTINYDQEGSFYPITPALAVQITPSISLGIALNFWELCPYDNKWRSEYRSHGAGSFAGIPFHVDVRTDEVYKMDGTQIDLFDPMNWRNANYHLGLMWNINHIFTLGAVFKSPFTASLQHDFRNETTIIFPTLVGFDSYNEMKSSETVLLDMPMSYGIGLAVRLSDSLTIDLDFYRTEWSDYVLHDAGGNRINPITGKLQENSDIADTTQVRFGGEYLIIGNKTIIPLRAGIFYDPEPAEGSPDDFFGFSLGTGITYKSYVFDIAYQYRFGRDVRSLQIGNQDSSQDVDQHTVYMSLIYHF